MSIARHLFREFRPFFRMLEEPFGRSPAYYPPAFRNRDTSGFLSDPFGGLNMLARPAVDVTEKGDRYIVEADLPGVSKENLQVRLGDGNQTVTIEGKVTGRMSSGASEASPESSAETKDTSASTSASNATSVAAKDEEATEISVERPYNRNYSFTRTVWLPQPVDPEHVTARLQNGVLMMTLNKLAQQDGSKVIQVQDA